MVRKRAERFEEAWQRQAAGESADESVVSLIETARKVEQLGRDAPPPPYRLAPGRQRFLTEAARLRSNASQRKERFTRMRVLRVASALVVFLMVAGMVFGVGSAAAASVPGEPLYNLKLGMEQVRMTLAVGSQAKVEASLDRLQERVSEFTDLAKMGEADEAVQARVQEALQTALQHSDQLEDKDRQKMLVKLDEALQRHEREMFQAGKEAAPGPQAQLESMVQLMAWVRQELQLHTGEAKGMEIGQRMLLRDRDRSSQEDVVPEPTEDVVTDEVSPASAEEGKMGNPDAPGAKNGAGGDTEVPGAKNGAGNDTETPGEQYQPADNPAEAPGPGEPPAEPGDLGPGPDAAPQAPAEDPGAYGPGPGATPEAKPGVYGPGPGQTQKPAAPAPSTKNPGTGVAPAAPTMTPSPEPQQGTGQGGTGTTAPKKP